ncbi:hypothetical protein QLX08_009835 [Tetragonisca angustula]|uniref:Uncharacterized protein n=1 Tax=Tetragonisca angustula TaxID=166442 RepID=A0AAW0ZET2_9HYME
MMDRFLRLGVSCPEATSRIVSRMRTRRILPSCLFCTRKKTDIISGGGSSLGGILCPCLTSGIEEPTSEQHEPSEGELWVKVNALRYMEYHWGPCGDSWV